MARPLRINVPDGWYHVYHRGTEHRAVFTADGDRAHFLELLAEVHDRYRVLVHAYVLMGTHYHALVQTPDANLSAAMQWLHLSYAAWFNARHDRVGPFWQGRFGSVPVEAGAWVYELSLYLHLNPVATTRFGLTKEDKRRERLGWQVPSKEQATRRLKTLREYPWSSYRAYAGYAKAPDWLTLDAVLERASRKKDGRQKQYRSDAQNRIRNGMEASVAERLTDRFAVGDEAFREHLKGLISVHRETTNKSELRQRAGFEDIVAAVEEMKGEAWNDFNTRYGDWGRALVMWGARRYGGMTLREIGERVGGVDYAAVSAMLKRFERRLDDRRIKRLTLELDRLLGAV